MDKNTIIGFALIGALVIGFSWWSQPSAEQIAEAQKQEQLAQEQAKKAQEAEAKKAEAAITPTQLDSASLAALPEYQKPRESKEVSLQNAKLGLKFSTRGAQPIYAEIKGYRNHKDGYEQENTPTVALMQGTDNYFNIPLKLKNGTTINTGDLTFDLVAQSDSICVFRLPLSGQAYIDFAYQLLANDYRVNFTIQGAGLSEVLSPESLQQIEWRLKMPQTEQSHKFEGQYSGLYYGQTNGDVDDLSSTGKDTETVEEELRWFAFKDKYFSSALINHSSAFSGNTLTVEALDEKSGYVRQMQMQTSVASLASAPLNMTYYFGPNDYNILKGYEEEYAHKDLNLDHLVYLGWSIFRSINQWLIIPVVDFLKDYIGSWGIIILLLTIFIKTLLFPFTYKSQVSQAKMRVLKPQVDAINKKYEGKDDQESMMKKQKETFALYGSVGASPMSGCLPMLLQMPFLIALYMYFPTSIYLRGQSFLWAEDLSTYDPVIRWSFDIPIISGLLGNHISLFCLLMTIVNVVYNRYMMNQSATSTGPNDPMASMKYMPYMMSIMFFFMFNQNASGLSYYYFISTLISIIQYFAIRASINEEKILAQMEENKKKPKKKGNSFMERLERIQKEQEAQRKATKK